MQHWFPRMAQCIQDLLQLVKGLLHKTYSILTTTNKLLIVIPMKVVSSNLPTISVVELSADSHPHILCRQFNLLSLREKNCSNAFLLRIANFVSCTIPLVTPYLFHDIWYGLLLINIHNNLFVNLEHLLTCCKLQVHNLQTTLVNLGFWPFDCGILML